ncbi:MAG: hypothetical protein LUF30_05835 [Lachnospiraceae bacterium]|nr:hypothetical protein [Lachnospiraceae bacterium]
MKQKKSLQTLCRLCIFLFVLLTGFWGSPSSVQQGETINTVLTASAATSSTPKLTAKITKNNILKLLKKYDTDGYYVLKKQIANGDDILTWFTGSSTILASIDTAVHEETHAFSFDQAAGYRQAAYYIGNKKSIIVTYTNVFYTKEMASSIPSGLRTFRYSTYISEASNYLASNQYGIYGLLNEFMAYRMGMSTMINLYDYLVDQDADWDMWRIFINQCENDMQAYAEFKYYMLHYLYYAKKNYPSVYKGIVQNTQFCKAYKKLEASYSKLITTYQKDLKELETYFKNKGYTLTVTNSSVTLTTYSGNRTSTSSISRFYTTYAKLQKQLSKSRYTTQHNRRLKGAA